MAVALVDRNGGGTAPDVDCVPNHQRNLTPALPFCERTFRAPVPRPYSKQLNTLGDLLLKYRLDSGFTRLQVAGQIGVTTATVRNWECNRTRVEVRFYPRILGHIGSAPIKGNTTTGALVREERRRRGLSQQQLARLTGVDQATIRRLEADTPRMSRRTVAKIIRYLWLP